MTIKFKKPIYALLMLLRLSKPFIYFVTGNPNFSYYLTWAVNYLLILIAHYFPISNSFVGPLKSQIWIKNPKVNL